MIDLARQEVTTTSETIVVKVGTRVLTDATGRLDRNQIESLSEQVHNIMETGRKVILVSSGAVGAGMGRLGLSSRPTDLADLQAVAAVGQSVLIEAYEATLRKHGRHAAQVLLTAADLDDRQRYLNARNTILALMRIGAVPVINENDTVAIEELMTSFGDNDRLAALVCNLIHAQLLVLLSDVEGLYTDRPETPGSKLVRTVEQLDDKIYAMVRDEKSGLSKGGMSSKLEAARIATVTGGNVIITSGRTPGVLEKIIASEPIGTLILAQGGTMTARKRWIGFSAAPHGRIILDDGARRAVTSGGRSLLAIGILSTEGNFHKGDVVVICNTAGKEFARGLTNYSAADLEKIKGLRTDKIGQVLGHCPYDEIIHRDNLIVTKSVRD